MTGRVLQGFCRVVFAVGFLVSGIEAHKPIVKSVVPTDPVRLLQQRVAAAGGVTWDFETGDLSGWNASGTAFARQPTFGDNPRARRRETANQQGNYWIGTYESYQGPGRGRPGGIQGDEPQGTLTSAEFTIPRSLSFRIGGGSRFETRVELVLRDQIEGEIRVIFASGRDSETMEERTWNLTKWAGQRGRIRIVDASSGAWGHINVDHFRFDTARGREAEVAGISPLSAIVPDLRGHTEQEAREMLRKAGLAVGRVTRARARVEPGTVYSQEYNPGSRVAPRTSVGFVLADPITIRVPQLVRHKREEARGLLERAGLSVGTVTYRESRSPSDTVLMQKPAAGSPVVIGSAVDLVLSKAMTVEVPLLLGLTEMEASRLLRDAELAVGRIVSEESRRPPNTVVSQRPAAGTRVGIGSRVTIVTAKPVTILVPDVVSLSESEARRMLSGLELVTGRVRPEESREAPGSILRQSIAAGTRVPAGTRIDLVTATPATVLVPALVGLKEGEARERLAASELKPGTLQFRESAEEPGTVTAQGIGPGVRVPLGTLVNLVVAAAETVAVPSFVGMSIEQARRRLRAGRLGIGDEQLRGTRVEPEGTVLAQIPNAGTRVAVGTPVALTVATPEIVTVPSVVGLPHGEAAAAIRAVGLTVGSVIPRFSLQAGGTVLAQALAPGAQTRFGTPMALDEARPRLFWMAPAAVLFLAAFAGLVRLNIRPATMPRIEIRTKAGDGSARLESVEGRGIRLEIRLQPVVDRGSQEVTGTAGDLIRDERREHDANRPEETS